MRIRNTQPYGIGLLYPSAEVFLSQPVRDGLHTIQFGNEMIDILVRDRGAKTTVITFHAAVRVNSTVPQLVGEPSQVLCRFYAGSGSRVRAA